MINTDVDMEGEPIDRAMTLASTIVHNQVEGEPTFAGLWLDLPAREIHLAFTDFTAADIVARLQTAVPRSVRLRDHDFRHTMAALQDLHQATSDYMERHGHHSLYIVDSTVEVKANQVHINLKHTTPPEVVEAIRARFPDAPLRLELTTARWSAY